MRHYNHRTEGLVSISAKIFPKEGYGKLSGSVRDVWIRYDMGNPPHAFVYVDIAIRSAKSTVPRERSFGIDSQRDMGANLGR
jgi:hypothetical protein